MYDITRKILIGISSTVLLVGTTTTGAVTDADIFRAVLYRDGSISCTGADDTSRRGGEVWMLPQPGKVQFKVELRKAAPNTSYTLAISEEPNCANAQFYPAVTTNEDGEADFYGTYTTTPGQHNLLVNLVTSNPNTPRNREIGTRNAVVVVPR